MTLAPASLAELSTALLEAGQRGVKITSVDLRAFHRTPTHAPEDMTVTVEAGVSLAALQSALGQRGQWLPLDPPHADTLTVGELLARDASGPRRFGHGTARDHLIGLKVALADGRIVQSGGKVVKNVAGYDLHKLFIGARGTLGVIVEATFKLRPRPEREQFIARCCATPVQAEKAIGAVLDSPVAPVVLDLHNLAGSPPQFTVVLGFAGAREEVDWQLEAARQLGFAEATTLDYERDFWAATGTPRRISVLPSRVCETAAALGGTPFVARAGNGLFWHRGPAGEKTVLPNAGLMRRVKDAFDPNHIFPEFAP